MSILSQLQCVNWTLQSALDSVTNQFSWVFASAIFSSRPERWEGNSQAKCIGLHCPLLTAHPDSTVGTPYNTAPYITGSNMAWLGHGSQNLWSKLWILVVKLAPVRVIFTWKRVAKKRLHSSSDIYLGTQWKQRHGSPRSYRLDVIVTFLWYGTIGIIWRRDHQSMAKKV